MCLHHTPTPVRPRFGSALEHGEAHTHDHQQWSRRDFLSSLSLFAMGSPFLLNRAVGAQSMHSAQMHRALAQTNPNRVLVLLQLGGGNDGLNTVVPFTNDLYYQARPSLALPRNEIVPITDTLGLHPSLAPFESLFGEGALSILQSVGYPSPDLSHFRGTDIWLSASDSDVVEETGWMGRYLESQFPTFVDEPTPYPLAVQIGASAPMLFQASANYGMSISNTDLLERIASEGILFDSSTVPATTYGEEMRYLRTVANDAYRYAGAVKTASDAGANAQEYPNNDLGRNLSTVARLIKGQLGSQIYHVSLGSFDTHANQANPHANLLTALAEATDAFYRDLRASGHSEDVLIMTFSEFGRRVQQNGSNGTDHGTSAPLFLLGDGLTGGLLGNAPDLTRLDATGNLTFDIDFRAVYASVLTGWFGLNAEDAAALLGQSFPSLDLFNGRVGTATQRPEVPETVLYDLYPNPVSTSATLRFATSQPMPVRLRLYDAVGRLQRTVATETVASGNHQRRVDVQGLPSGTYLLRLETPTQSLTQPVTVVR
ncbi:MAG: hypothetical protein RhofKO_04060 [Rhodothermales bacterium]